MTTTNVCRDALSEGIRTASVHLIYPTGTSESGWWFQRLVVTNTSSVSFFASSAHAVGYGGVQQLTKYPRKGRAIFSIWDQGGCDRDVGACSDDDVAKTLACSNTESLRTMRTSMHTWTRLGLRWVSQQVGISRASPLRQQLSRTQTRIECLRHCLQSWLNSPVQGDVSLPQQVTRQNSKRVWMTLAPRHIHHPRLLHQRLHLPYRN